MRLKDLVIKAIENLMKEGKKEFTSTEIYNEVEKIEPGRKKSSVFSTLSSIAVQGELIEKTGRGRYRLSPEGRVKIVEMETRELIPSLIKMLRQEGLTNRKIREIIMESLKILDDE